MVMSETDELDEIRQRKRERLEEQANSPDSDGQEAQEAPSEPIHVTGSEHLEDVVSTHDVVLVDFYADWCGPCKMLEPIVEALARESAAAVAKVDVDANQVLASEYGVRGVPTLVLFAGGEPVEQLVGVQDRSALENLIEQHAA